METETKTQIAVRWSAGYMGWETGNSDEDNESLEYLSDELQEAVTSAIGEWAETYEIIASYEAGARSDEDTTCWIDTLDDLPHELEQLILDAFRAWRLGTE